MLAIVGAVLLVAGILVGLIQFASSDDPPAAGPATPQSSAPRSNFPTASPTWRLPVPSTTPDKDCITKCFPGVKLATVVSQLEAKGYTCKAVSSSQRCELGDDHVVSVRPAPGNATKVGMLMVTAYSGQDEYPDGRTRTLALIQADAQVLVPLVMPDLTTGLPVSRYLRQRLPTCTTADTTKLGGYEVRCTKPLPTTAQGTTTWSSGFTVYGLSP